MLATLALEECSGAFESTTGFEGKDTGVCGGGCAESKVHDWPDVNPAQAGWMLGAAGVQSDTEDCIEVWAGESIFEPEKSAEEKKSSPNPDMRAKSGNCGLVEKRREFPVPAQSEFGS